MVDLEYYLTNLLFCDIHYTITLNIRLSVIFCLSYGDIYLSLGISIGISSPFSFVTVSELFCCKFFETSAVVFIFHYYTILISVHQ